MPPKSSPTPSPESSHQPSRKPPHRFSRAASNSIARRLLFVFLTAAALGLLCAGPLRAQAPFANIAAADRALAGNAPAFRALQEGRVDDAQSLLNATLAAHPSDAAAHQLLCRVYYAQDAADAAIRHCELAVAADPRNSDHQLWLGRAYGMKASRAGPFAGFSLARKVHASFERAVQLNPSNVAALSDLGEYYVAAPSIVGGGMDKAQALAARILPQFPIAGHRLLARIAEANHDLPTAESEFKLAVAAQKTPEAWIDLAQFYQAHNRPDEALAAIKSALAADRSHGPVLVDAASILTAAHRDPALAERCLRDYLASRAKSDAAPAFKVHLQFGRLLAARGDATDANRELATAAVLAPTFTHTAKQGS